MKELIFLGPSWQACVRVQETQDNSFKEECEFCVCIKIFFNDTATTEIYTLPYTTLFRSCIVRSAGTRDAAAWAHDSWGIRTSRAFSTDRKSTRLNSSHRCISYAVFCL